MSLLVDGVDANIEALTNWSWSALAALAYLVVLATLVGYGIWATLLRHYPASTVAPFSLLVPVVGDRDGLGGAWGSAWSGRTRRRAYRARWTAST
jgi:O-acetylserine/cysteine efflux transporter